MPKMRANHGSKMEILSQLWDKTGGRTLKKPTNREFQFEVTYCLITRRECANSFEPQPNTVGKYRCSSCKLAWEKKNPSS